MPDFQFTPTDGFRNQASFPNPTTETEARNQVQYLLDQIRDYLNTLDSTTIDSPDIPGITGATVYAQIANLLAIAQAAQAGTILPGVVTDTMLSNNSGQIKDTVSSHIEEKAKYQTATGSNTIAITTGGDFALTQGNFVKWVQASANTEAVTINVDAKGAKALKNSDKGALAANDLEAGKGYEAYYSLSDDFFVLPPRGAKLTEIINAIAAKGGSVASPQKVAEIVSAINTVATWDPDLIAGNIKTGVNIFGIIGSYNPLNDPIVAGDNIAVADDTVKGVSGVTNYTKYFEIKMLKSGTIRVSFDLYASNYILGKVYINGSPVGTERDPGATTLTWITYTQDFTVNANDLVQLYMMNNAGQSGSGRNFRIKASQLGVGVVTM